MGKWIGVDLDGTLAEYKSNKNRSIGEAIEPMLQRVKQWIDDGKEVRVFTARASDSDQVKQVEKWLSQNGLGGLAVTNVKDFDMVELWDDKAIRVKRNTGYPCSGCSKQENSSLAFVREPSSLVTDC